MRTEQDTDDQSFTVVIVAPRDSLATASAASPSVTVVAATTDADRALGLVTEESPDVVVVHSDIADAPALCRRIRHHVPAARILAVSGVGVDGAHDDGGERGHRMILGGAASLLPGHGPTDLSDAIVALSRGEAELTPAVAARVLADIDRWAERSADPLHPPPTLTATEREVLIRRAAGASSAEIAEAHMVTTHLVDLHAGYAVAKLQRYVIDERVTRG